VKQKLSPGRHIGFTRVSRRSGATCAFSRILSRFRDRFREMGDEITPFVAHINDLTIGALVASSRPWAARTFCRRLMEKAIIHVKVQYDAVNRTFKLVDHQFKTLLEGDRLYDLSLSVVM